MAAQGLSCHWQPATGSLPLTEAGSGRPGGPPTERMLRRVVLSGPRRAWPRRGARNLETGRLELPEAPLVLRPAEAGRWPLSFKLEDRSAAALTGSAVTVTLSEPTRTPGEPAGGLQPARITMVVSSRMSRQGHAALSGRGPQWAWPRALI